MLLFVTVLVLLVVQNTNGQAENTNSTDDLRSGTDVLEKSTLLCGSNRRLWICKTRLKDLPGDVDSTPVGSGCGGCRRGCHRFGGCYAETRMLEDENGGNITGRAEGQDQRGNGSSFEGGSKEGGRHWSRWRSERRGDGKNWFGQLSSNGTNETLETEKYKWGQRYGGCKEGENCTIRDADGRESIYHTVEIGSGKGYSTGRRNRYWGEYGLNKEGHKGVQSVSTNKTTTIEEIYVEDLPGFDSGRRKIFSDKKRGEGNEDTKVDWADAYGDHYEYYYEYDEKYPFLRHGGNFTVEDFPEEGEKRNFTNRRTTIRRRRPKVMRHGNGTKYEQTYYWEEGRERDKKGMVMFLKPENLTEEIRKRLIMSGNNSQKNVRTEEFIVEEGDNIGLQFNRNKENGDSRRIITTITTQEIYKEKGDPKVKQGTEKIRTETFHDKSDSSRLIQDGKSAVTIVKEVLKTEGLNTEQGATDGTQRKIKTVVIKETTVERAGDKPGQVTSKRTELDEKSQTRKQTALSEEIHGGEFGQQIIKLRKKTMSEYPTDGSSQIKTVKTTIEEHVEGSNGKMSTTINEGVAENTTSSTNVEEIKSRNDGAAKSEHDTGRTGSITVVEEETIGIGDRLKNNKRAVFNPLGLGHGRGLLHRYFARGSGGRDTNPSTVHKEVTDDKVKYVIGHGLGLHGHRGLHGLHTIHGIGNLGKHGGVLGHGHTAGNPHDVEKEETVKEVAKERVKEVIGHGLGLYGLHGIHGLGNIGRQRGVWGHGHTVGNSHVVEKEEVVKGVTEERDKEVIGHGLGLHGLHNIHGLGRQRGVWGHGHMTGNLHNVGKEETVKVTTEDKVKEVTGLGLGSHGLGSLGRQRGALGHGHLLGGIIAHNVEKGERVKEIIGHGLGLGGLHSWHGLGRQGRVWGHRTEESAKEVSGSQGFRETSGQGKVEVNGEAAGDRSGGERIITSIRMRGRGRNRKGGIVGFEKDSRETHGMEGERGEEAGKRRSSVTIHETITKGTANKGLVGGILHGIVGGGIGKAWGRKRSGRHRGRGKRINVEGEDTKTYKAVHGIHQIAGHRGRGKRIRIGGGYGETNKGVHGVGHIIGRGVGHIFEHGKGQDGSDSDGRQGHLMKWFKHIRRLGSGKLHGGHRGSHLHRGKGRRIHRIKYGEGKQVGEGRGYGKYFRVVKSRNGTQGTFDHGRPGRRYIIVIRKIIGGNQTKENKEGGGATEIIKEHKTVVYESAGKNVGKVDTVEQFNEKDRNEHSGNTYHEITYTQDEHSRPSGFKFNYTEGGDDQYVTYIEETETIVNGKKETKIKESVVPIHSINMTGQEEILEYDEEWAQSYNCTEEDGGNCTAQGVDYYYGDMEYIEGDGYYTMDCPEGDNCTECRECKDCEDKQSSRKHLRKIDKDGTEKIYEEVEYEEQSEGGKPIKVTKMVEKLDSDSCEYDEYYYDYYTDTRALTDIDTKIETTTEKIDEVTTE